MVLFTPCVQAVPYPVALILKAAELRRDPSPTDFTASERADIHATLGNCIKAAEGSLARILKPPLPRQEIQALAENLGHLQDAYVAFSVALGAAQPKMPP